MRCQRRAKHEAEQGGQRTRSGEHLASADDDGQQRGIAGHGRREHIFEFEERGHIFLNIYISIHQSPCGCSKMRRVQSEGKDMPYIKIFCHERTKRLI